MNRNAYRSGKRYARDVYAAKIIEEVPTGQVSGDFREDRTHEFLKRRL